MFTPTAEKLIPDLTPREELVVLARALWREGYNDHLAGHITVNLGDGTLLCNPWLLTWAELRPVPGAAHRPRRPGGRGGLAGPARDPAAPRAAQAAPDVGWAVHNHPLFGTVWADLGELPPILDQSSALGGGTLALVDEYEGPVNDAGERPAGGGEDGRRVDGAAGRARRVRPGRLGPGGASAGGGARAAVPARLVRPGGRRRRASPGSRRRSSTWWPQSDGEGFIGFWEAAVRAELAADPDLLGLTTATTTSRRPRPVPWAPGCRAARRCTTPGHGRDASARTTSRAGSGRAGGGRTRPRTRASGRSGSQVMSLPAFQRFMAPGARPSAWASAHPAQGWSFSGVLPVGLELGDQLAAAGHAEPRRHADVVQRPGVVEEAEQERAHAGAVLVGAEAGHDAVGRALVLHLEHGPLVGQVVRGRRP